MGFIRNIFRRIRLFFGRRAERVVVIQPTPTRGNRTHAYRNQQQYQRVNPIQSAIRNIFSPKHADIEQTAYQVIGKDGVVDEDVELWERQGNSMKVTRRKTKVISCSGAVVDASAIKGVCGSCNNGFGFTESVYRCRHCGKIQCALCVRIITLENGELVTLCRRHAKAQIRRTNLWERFDNNTKKKIGIKTESSQGYDSTNPIE